MKYQGTKNACSMTKQLPLSGLKVLLFYDPDENEIYSFLDTNGTAGYEWNGHEHIIAVADTTEPMTMQEIEDAVDEAIRERC